MKRFGAIKQDQRHLLAELKARLLCSSNELPKEQERDRSSLASVHRVTKARPTVMPARSETARTDRARAFSGPSRMIGTIQLEKLEENVHLKASGFGMCRVHAITRPQRRYLRNWQVCKLSLSLELWWIVELRMSVYGRGRRDGHFRLQWRELTRSTPSADDSFSRRAIGVVLHLSVNADSFLNMSHPSVEPVRQGEQRSTTRRAREAKLAAQRVAVGSSRSEGGSALIAASAVERRKATPRQPITLPPAIVPARPLVAPDDGWSVCPRCRGELSDCLRPDCENGWIRVKRDTDVVHAIALRPLPTTDVSGRVGIGGARGASPNPSHADHEALHRADPNSSAGYPGDTYLDGGRFGSLPLHDDYDS